MNNDRRAILALIALGRITPAEAERLLAACNESREIPWIVGLALGVSVLAQVPKSRLWPLLLHFFNVHFLALAGAANHQLSLIADRIGGLL